ncbi:endoglucanase [Planosporangium mesophilum]|uniref:Endoglucanase n=2 Tax=Planosporangium mesophilum TaxID=689768 RepID=A0A8J3TAI5_9ACTN|nr:glycoside hydrolase family 9 protein [Planosporangium mesophilum]NJC83253.1 glycosyl hydrolase family 5 [Planosporangium mesophilum]GII21627.1 endoglucanase [Planosporangium mesophilum]
MRAAVTAATALTATGLLAIGPGATAFAAEPTNPSGLSANAQPGAVPEMYKSGTGPKVRVNQVGYLTNGPKNATLTTGAETGLPWQLKDAKGKVVATGTTTPRGLDGASAHNVHSIDFSKYATPGKGYKLVVDGEASHPFAIGDNLYETLRQDALKFYYTQRSGIAVDDKLRPGYGRPAGHVSQDETGDLAVGCLNNGCDYKLNVKGGWYDAGDQGKYVVNGGISVFQLMNQFERSKTAKTADAKKMGDGTLAIPESRNKVPDILDEARWEQEFLLSMQVPDGKTNAGMAHHKIHDESWTGLPTLPHQDTKKRVLHPPSTAATLNLAATGAQAARVFAPYDKKFAEKNLVAAKKAWAAAKANPNMMASGDSGSGGGGYGDWNLADEFYWAAAELYLTTGDKEFADYIQNSSLHKDDIWNERGFSWDRVAALGRLDLATVPSNLPDRERIRESVVTGADKYLAALQKNPWGMPYSPSDNRYDWGSNSLILNNMVVMATAFDITGETKYRDGVLQGMDYILGRNVLNRSYVTGYGSSYSVNQHSRWYAHQLDKKLPPPPAGTIAGGPNGGNEDDLAKKQLAGCVGQFCYMDDIMAFASNELTINWNAPLSWVTAFVSDQKGSSAPKPAPAPADPAAQK